MIYFFHMHFVFIFSFFPSFLLFFHFFFLNYVLHCIVLSFCMSAHLSLWIWPVKAKATQHAVFICVTHCNPHIRYICSSFGWTVNNSPLCWVPEYLAKGKQRKRQKKNKNINCNESKMKRQWEQYSENNSNNNEDQSRWANKTSSRVHGFFRAFSFTTFSCFLVIFLACYSWAFHAKFAHFSALFKFNTINQFIV